MTMAERSDNPPAGHQRAAAPPALSTDGQPGAPVLPVPAELPTDHPAARLPRRRVLAGLLLAAIGLPGLTALLANLRSHIDLPGVLLLYLLVVVIVATVGGALPAAIAAVAGFLLANWYFTPPFHRLAIAERRNLLALVVFLIVAGVVSALVDAAARRTAEATRARAEAAALARLGAILLQGDDPLPELVEQLRSAFALQGVAVLRRDRRGWRVEATAGPAAPIRPEYATDAIALDDTATLTLLGRRLTGDDRRVLRAFTDQLTVALESRRLARAAADAVALAESNQLRTALLQAVSHDLRTPLASIKTSVTSLLQHDVTWPPEATRQFLATIDEETDRLNTLVGNLLDMSRLQAGALSVLSRPVGLEEVVAAALAGLGGHGQAVEVDVPETLTRVPADPTLLERAIANVVSNAVAWSPGRPVRLAARENAGRIELRVIDHGPGIPAEDRQRIFQPFQRLGDNANHTGVGLGLAVARGFVQALNGEILFEETPGGGLTVVFDLPAASHPAPSPADHPPAPGTRP
jgi:two-component system, OmpR family, sensor histidine kinase KdpD